MIKNTKRIYLICILLLTPLITTSCMGSIEINKLAIVTAIGIDKSGENTAITIEFIDAGTKNGEEGDAQLSDVMYIQGEGKTPFEAIKDMELYFDRKFIFSHAHIIIFGEEFAKSGVTDVLDFFLRDHGPREGAYMVVAKNSRADEILGVNTGIEVSTGNYINGALENYKHNSKCVVIPITEYLKYHYDKSNEAVIGVVEKIEQPEIDMTKKQKNPVKYFLDVSGGAVFKGDKLTGYFTGDEMIGFNFIIDDIKESLIVFKTPIKGDSDKYIIGVYDGYTSINEIKTSTSKNIKVNKNSIHLDIEVKLRGNLIEVQQALDISKASVIDDIEKACSKRIEELISNTLNKGQKEFQQDSFSIGVLMHRQYPKLWEEVSDDWHSIFKDITYSVNVKTKIVKSGMLNVPMNLKESY